MSFKLHDFVVVEVDRVQPGLQPGSQQRCIGFVTWFAMLQDTEVDVHLNVYEEAPLVDHSGYAIKHPEWIAVHWLLQTDKSLQVPASKVVWVLPSSGT